MVSYRSSVISNMFMVYFETEAIELSNLKTKLWIRYIVDILIMWAMDRKKYNFFYAFQLLTPQNPMPIRNTENNSLLFIETLVSEEGNNLTYYTVCRNPTHNIINK